MVNTISWASSASGALLEGDSTDGAGFLDALRGDDGFEPTGRRCVILGAGGAARAVTLALAEAGASVGRGRRLAGRKLPPGCAGLAGAVGRALTPVSPGKIGRTLTEVVRDADLVVNATPVGMAPGDGLPFALDPTVLRRGQFVADLIYAPATTPLLAAARSRGAATANGLGMLINQAARQVAIWTGRPAPVEAMSAAALGRPVAPAPLHALIPARLERSRLDRAGRLHGRMAFR